MKASYQCITSIWKKNNYIYHENFGKTGTTWRQKLRRDDLTKKLFVIDDEIKTFINQAQLSEEAKEKAKEKDGSNVPTKTRDASTQNEKKRPSQPRKLPPKTKKPMLSYKSHEYQRRQILQVNCHRYIHKVPQPLVTRTPGKLKTILQKTRDAHYHRKGANTS